jgi:hypothetical protein
MIKMKIFYDSNNFVRKAVSFETCVCLAHKDKCDLEHEDLGIIETDGLEYQGLTCINYSNFDSSLVLIDEYELPKYKWINNSLVEVTSPLDYQVDVKLWEIYLKKVEKEVIELINTKNNDELKAFYEESPEYIKDIMYRQIETIEASQVPQVSMNLVLEIMLRIYAEKEYVARIEQRELTEDESNAINAVLTIIHDHSFGMGMPLSMTSWWIPYLTYMLDTSDNLRMATISKRFYITGKY